MAVPMDGADASRRLLRRYIAQEPVDLVRAALAVAREEYPDLDEGGYLRVLDRIAEGVQTGLPSGATPERRVGRINTHLFHELGFSGNHNDYYDPRNSFLNEVLDRRTGIPLTLSAVDRLLLLAPDNVRGLRERAQLYELLGGSAAAAADLEKVLSLEPNASDALVLRARLRRLRDTSQFLN